MRTWSVAVGVLVLSAGVACSHNTKTESQAPAPARGAGPAQRVAGAGGGEGRGEGRGPEGRGGPPGGAPGGVRRAPPPPNWERQDSVRKALMAEVLATIPGKENEPAGKVFQNVKFNRDMPAKQFLTMMDEQYGRSVGASCTGCHVNTNVNGVLKVDYANDKSKKKQIVRLMEEMTQQINKDLKKNTQLDEDYPKATCVMCHRGTEHMPNTMKQPKNSDPPPPTRQKGGF